MFWLTFQPSNVTLLLLTLFKAYRVSEPFYCALYFLAVHFPHLNVLEVLCIFIRINVWLLFVVALKKKDVPNEVLSPLRFYILLSLLSTWLLTAHLLADYSGCCAVELFLPLLSTLLITFQPLLSCWRWTWKQKSSCPLPLFLLFDFSLFSSSLSLFPPLLLTLAVLEFAVQTVLIYLLLLRRGTMPGLRK